MLKGSARKGEINGGGGIYPLLQILGYKESEGSGDWMVTPQRYPEKKKKAPKEVLLGSSIRTRSPFIEHLRCARH